MVEEVRKLTSVMKGCRDEFSCTRLSEALPRIHLYIGIFFFPFFLEEEGGVVVELRGLGFRGLANRFRALPFSSFKLGEFEGRKY